MVHWGETFFGVTSWIANWHSPSRERSVQPSIPTYSQKLVLSHGSETWRPPEDLKRKLRNPPRVPPSTFPLFPLLLLLCSFKPPITCCPLVSAPLSALYSLPFPLLLSVLSCYGVPGSLLMHALQLFDALSTPFAFRCPLFFPFILVLSLAVFPRLPFLCLFSPFLFFPSSLLFLSLFHYLTSILMSLHSFSTPVLFLFFLLRVFPFLNHRPFPVFFHSYFFPFLFLSCNLVSPTYISFALLPLQSNTLFLAHLVKPIWPFPSPASP